MLAVMFICHASLVNASLPALSPIMALGSGVSRVVEHELPGAWEKRRLRDLSDISYVPYLVHIFLSSQLLSTEPAN